MLSLEPTFAAASISLSPANSLNLTLLSDGVSGTKNEAELNDFNIAQLQLEYETSMDTSLDTMHPLDSIDLLHDNSHPHHPHNPHTHAHALPLPLPHTDLDAEQDLDTTDSDYAARRMSSSAISSASAQSAQSVHSVRTSTTAATSNSGFSAHGQHIHGQSLKRAQSPGGLDEFDAYDAFDNSPRAKRARPSLSLEPGVARMDSASPAPTNTTASAGGTDGSGAAGTGTGRVQLPPLFSALENTSNSAPPTSHGTHAPFAHPSGQMQFSYSQPSHSHSVSQGQGQSPFPTSNFAFNVSGTTGLDLRRGSLPSLYSNSLAARSAQRVPNQGQGQGQYMHSQNARSTYGYPSGLSPGPSPLSSLSAPGGTDDASGLAGYQFPAPSALDSGSGSSGSNGSGSGQGSTPTPTPGTGASTSPFSSGMTPTSSLSSAPSSSFPHTPLDFAHQQQHSHSYQNAYGQQSQSQSQKEYDRFAKEYLTSSPEWSTTRPASAGNTPASATSAFSFNTASSGGLGGLPRISGHAKSADQQQEWFSSNGHFVLPSPSIGSGSGSPAQQQQQQHPQTASLSPSPRAHSSTSASSSATAMAAATAASLNVSQAAAVQAASVAAQVAARPARRRGKLPKPTTDFLKDWLHRHSDHPYPSEEEKKQLCNATGLSMSQVSNWMINARRRILAPAQRTPQGPTTTVPSFPLGSAHSSSSMNRAPLGLSPAHAHGHHGMSSAHLSQNNYGMSMGTGLSGMGMGLIGGLGGGMGSMGGMGYQQQQQHQLHAAQGLGMGSSASMYQQQQYRQQQHQQQQALGHSALYDLGLHAQRRASMPALALHGHSHAQMSPLGGGNGSLQLYPPTGGSTRSSLPGALPQVGYAQQQQQQQAAAYSPQQGQLGSPAPQRGYVFPPPGSSGSNSGAGNEGDDGR